jgi:hypothetical protein
MPFCVAFLGERKGLKSNGFDMRLYKMKEMALGRKCGLGAGLL